MTKQKRPIIVINFKTYKSGKDVLKLARIVEKFDKNIIVGVGATELYRVSSKTKLRVFAQHVDAIEPGRNTGFISASSAKTEGARGVFLNHSEHKLKWGVLKKTVRLCRESKLEVLIFINDLKEAKKVKKLKPDYIVYEPPQLVGGKVSVSKSKPEVIEKIHNKLNYPFIVGAGIKSKEDVKIAMKLGASGVALSSAFTKSKNPRNVLKNLFG